MMIAPRATDEHTRGVPLPWSLVAACVQQLTAGNVYAIKCQPPTNRQGNARDFRLDFFAVSSEEKYSEAKRIVKKKTAVILCRISFPFPNCFGTRLASWFGSQARSRSLDDHL